MKKQLFKCIATLMGLASACLTQAAPTTNGNLSNQTSALQSQAANTQNATNSLIRWLNANFVTGTPLQFPQSMKANLQTILANYSISDLDWQVTKGITFIALKGEPPADKKTQDALQAQNNQSSLSLQDSQTADINSLDSNNLSNLVPRTTDSDKSIAQKLSQFNIGKLLSTTSFAPKSEDDKNALILMQFLSGLANSMGPLSPQELGANRGPIDAYQQEYGSYLAQQSLGVNALFSLINERIVQKGLGSQLGGPQADMSPLALDQYMATRRLNANDPNGWLAQLPNATPAQATKELLMLMSEMRYEMYLERRDLETIQTLLAVQELQSNDLKKNDLIKLQASISSAALPAAIN